MNEGTSAYLIVSDMICAHKKNCYRRDYERRTCTISRHVSGLSNGLLVEGTWLSRFASLPLFFWAGSSFTLLAIFFFLFFFLPLFFLWPLFFFWRVDAAVVSAFFCFTMLLVAHVLNLICSKTIQKLVNNSRVLKYYEVIEREHHKCVFCTLCDVILQSQECGQMPVMIVHNPSYT